MRSAPESAPNRTLQTLGVRAALQRAEVRWQTRPPTTHPEKWTEKPRLTYGPISFSACCSKSSRADSLELSVRTFPWDSRPDVFSLSTENWEKILSSYCNHTQLPLQPVSAFESGQELAFWASVSLKTCSCKEIKHIFPNTDKVFVVIWWRT